MATAKHCREEIADTFKDLAPDVLNGLGAIGEFLSQGDVDSQLRELDRALLDLLKSRSSRNISDQKRIAKAQEYFEGWKDRAESRKAAIKGGNPDADIREKREKKYSHLLSTVLLEHEGHFGLNKPLPKDELPEGAMIGSAKSVNLVGLVDSKFFNGLLNNYILAKDAGASPTHGEYTHRIQWHIVSRKFPFQNYQKLIATIGGTTREPDISLWDYLFDRFENKQPMVEGKRDYRSPTLLNTHIRGSKNLFPLLSAFCQSRLEKRFDHNGQYREKLGHQYAATHVYGKDYDQLEEKDRDVIDQSFEKKGAAIFPGAE